MRTKIVWDHTSIGSPVIFHPGLTSPLLVLLKEQTIGLGCRYLASVDCEHGMYNATLGVGKSGEGLVTTVDRFDERTGPAVVTFLLPGDIAVPCTFHQRAVCLEEKTTGDYVCKLKSLHRSVSSSSEVSLSRCLSLRLHLHLVGPTCKMDIEGLAPSNSFRAVPVPPIPLLPTALSESMARDPGRSAKTGFLTMESSQRLVLLLENDPRVKSCPLIGIWVSGVCTLVDPVVWAACLRFFTSCDYSKRVVRPEQPFLLVIYSSLHSGPEFYDCLCNSSALSYTLLEGHCQITVTKVPSFSSRVCAVDLLPVENHRTLRLFQDALTIFQKDLPPLPYCDSAALAFPSDSRDYPRASPNPVVKTFILQPSVPDLSLLSETSKCSTKPYFRPPLRPLNDAAHPMLSSKTNTNSKPQILHPSFNQKTHMNRFGLTDFIVNPLNTSMEPLPRSKIESKPKEVTFSDLRDEVSRILEPKSTVKRDWPSHNVGSSDRTDEGASGRNNQGNMVPNYSAGHEVAISNKNIGNVTSERDHKVVPDTSPNVSEEKIGGGVHTNKSALFENIHELLKQKDNRMSELQEQVKELLDIQKNQLVKPSSPAKRSDTKEDDNNLMHKIDCQNEQLNLLKEQISLLLDNQVKQQQQHSNIEVPNYPKSSTTVPEIEKCSVGVMTSIVPETFFKTRLHEATADSLQGQFEAYAQPAGGRLIEPNSDTNTKQLNEVVAVIPEERAEKRRSRQCCACHCSREENQLSVEDLRLGTMDSKMSPEPSLRLDLEQLRPPVAFSVDCSLPLGASVSLFEDCQFRQVQRLSPSSAGSEDDDRNKFPAAFHPPGVSRKTAPDDWIEITRRRTNRLSLPNKQDKPQRIDEDERRLSYSESNSFHRNVLPSAQKWEGSMLLPRLNYQTLCLSDESDCETDPLTHMHRPSNPRPGVFRPKQGPNMISVDAYSKNMSFATKQYLERYGLVS